MFHDTSTRASSQQILAGNAAKLYDFDLDALAPQAEQVGPTVAEIAEPLTELPENANMALQRGCSPDQPARAGRARMSSNHAWVRSFQADVIPHAYAPKP